MSIPSTYTHADKLGADGRGALACAWLVWKGLSKTMRRTLVMRWDMLGRWDRGTASLPTLFALHARGLVVSPEQGEDLTALGRLVREAGTRTPTSAGES